MLFGIIPRCIEPLSSHHYLHVRPFTYSSLAEFLNRGGFTVTDFRSNRIKLSPFQGLKLDVYWLADLLPSIGQTLIVTARKDRGVKAIALDKE